MECESQHRKVSAVSSIMYLPGRRDTSVVAGRILMARRTQTLRTIQLGKAKAVSAHLARQNILPLQCNQSHSKNALTTYWKSELLLPFAVARQTGPSCLIQLYDKAWRKITHLSADSDVCKTKHNANDQNTLNYDTKPFYNKGKWSNC